MKKSQKDIWYEEYKKLGEQLAEGLPQDEWNKKHERFKLLELRIFGEN